MNHIPLGADIIVRENKKLLAFCLLPPSLSVQMIFKLSHKTTDQKELKPQTGDKTKEAGNKDTDLLENGLEDMGRGWGEM